MSRFIGRMAGKVVGIIRQVGWSDVLVVGGSVSLYYGLAQINPALGFVAVGLIWLGVGLVIAWRKGGG